MPLNNKYIYSPIFYQVCVLFSYVGVGIVLFIVSRFSPNEWKLLEPGGKRIACDATAIIP